MIRLVQELMHLLYLQLVEWFVLLADTRLRVNQMIDTLAHVERRAAAARVAIEGWN
jgi:hypothetical protein